MTEQPDWTRAYLLMGQDIGGDLVPVLANSGGQIVVLFQGQLGGTPTTVAVDADGRIEFFALDDEDQWGQVLRVGNAELAARTFSPRTFDWRGNTLFHTDYMYGLGGAYTLASGTGSSVSVDTTYWLMGGNSVALTGGSDGLGSAEIAYFLPKSPGARVGGEIWFAINGETAYIFLTVESAENGVDRHGTIRLDVQGQKMHYKDDSSVYQEIPDVAFSKTVVHWHALKLVIDRAAAKYVRVMFEGIEYDLSAYDLYDSGATANQYYKIQVVNFSRAGNNDRIFIDRLIATSAEQA